MKLKKVITALKKFGFFLVFLPASLLYNGIVKHWYTAFDTIKGRNTVAGLLQYGRHDYFPEKRVRIVVAKNIKEVLWEGGCGYDAHIPESILKMRVSTWDVIDGEIWIKVLINDRFIQELEEELKQKEDPET